MKQGWATVLHNMVAPLQTKTTFQAIVDAQDSTRRPLPVVSASKIWVPSVKRVCYSLPLPGSVVDRIMEYLPRACVPHVSMVVPVPFDAERTGLMLFMIAALELTFPVLATRHCAQKKELTIDVNGGGHRISHVVDDCLRLYSDLPLNLGADGIRADLVEQRNMLFHHQVVLDVAGAVPSWNIEPDCHWPLQRVTILTHGFPLPHRVYSGLLYLCLPLMCGQTLNLQIDDEPFVSVDVYGTGPVLWVNRYETYNPIDYSFDAFK
jgi:hypothetical protein